MSMFVLKTIAEMLVRLILLSPLIAGLFYTGEYTSYVDNVSTFILVILGLASALYLSVVTLIPPEYAIKTDIKILEFNTWLPQVIAVNFMGVFTLGICIVLASQAEYIAATVLFFYSLSHFLWVKYAKRIDSASKEHMLNQLTQ